MNALGLGKLFVFNKKEKAKQKEEKQEENKVVPMRTHVKAPPIVTKGVSNCRERKKR